MIWEIERNSVPSSLMWIPQLEVDFSIRASYFKRLETEPTICDGGGFTYQQLPSLGHRARCRNVIREK